MHSERALWGLAKAQMVIRGRRRMLLRCCHICCQVLARATASVSVISGARGDAPAGVSDVRGRTQMITESWTD
jgi:hypothetical protein